MRIVESLNLKVCKSVKKKWRIKKNEDFQAVFKRGKSYANRQFVIYVLPKEDQEQFRVGLSVSKKLGNAVTRNKIKRAIRRSIFELKEKIVAHNDYIIIARQPVSHMDFDEIKKSLNHAFKVAKCIKK